MPTLGAKVLIRKMEPGWRLLRNDGYSDKASPSFGGLPAPAPDWVRITRTLLNLDLDTPFAKERVAALLPLCGYGRYSKNGRDESAKGLVRWDAGDVTSEILDRVKVVQATLRVLYETDVVQEIREEYLYMDDCRNAMAKAFQHSYDTRGVITEKQRTNLLKRERADISLESSPSHKVMKDITDLAADRGWDTETTLKELIGKEYKPGGASQVVLPKFREKISEKYIADRVAQSLINIGRGAILCEFWFDRDGTPTVLAYADEPFDEMILRAHVRRTLSQWVKCANPRCKLKWPFRAARSSKMYCGNRCRDYVKKAKSRSIDTAITEWNLLSRSERSSKLGWLSQRASSLASELAGGYIRVERRDVNRSIKKRG